MSGFIRQHSMENAFNTSDSWVILNPIEQSIKAKIEKIGKPLKEWDIKIYRGILTGCNEAFIIDAGKRKEILANCATQEERKRTDELIRPILRGRDIKRYGYNFANLYLIASHNGIPGKKIPRINIDDYPAVKRHLDSFWPQISKRSDMGDTPYNLRSCAYWEDLNRQKIIWGEISDKTKFAIDAKGDFFAEATTFIMTGTHLQFLVCFLNSALSEYLFSKIGTTTGVGTVRWKKFKIEQLLVPCINKVQEKVFITLLAQISPDNKAAVEEAINQQVFDLCGLSGQEIDFAKNTILSR